MIKKPLTAKNDTVLHLYGLNPADYKKAVHLTFKPGEYLSREGEALDYLYFVISGRAKVILSLSDGKQLLLGSFISQGLIGDIELMTNVEVNQATLQAVTSFECIALPLSQYRAKLKANNKFINHVGCELAEKLIGRAVNGAINTLQPLEERLCAYIMQTAVVDEVGIYCFAETLTEVAVMVGTSYRHLLRGMNKLCEGGVLRKIKKAYQIVDWQALNSMAGDLYVLK